MSTNWFSSLSSSSRKAPASCPWSERCCHSIHISYILTHPGLQVPKGADNLLAFRSGLRISPPGDVGQYNVIVCCMDCHGYLHCG